MHPEPQTVDLFAQLVQSLGPVGALVVGYLVREYMRDRGREERRSPQPAPPPAECSPAVQTALKDLAKQVERTASAQEKTLEQSRNLLMAVESLVQSSHYEHKEIAASLVRIESR